MRQHVNPLSSYFQAPLNLPKIGEIFENDKLPVHLDIGCAKGKFLFDMAVSDSSWNYLGVEIREKLIKNSQSQIKKLGIKNLNILYCNANISLDTWLSNIEIGQIRRVTIQFPDPWFKRKHYKRRVLQPKLLCSIASSLLPGSELFIQTDVLPLMEYMTSIIEESKCFDRDMICWRENWLNQNPFLIETERESIVKKEKKEIYRAMYFRNANKCPEVSYLEKILINYESKI